MARKNGLVDFLDNLPWIAKLIFCFPMLDIAWGVYRIVKGITTTNVLMIVFVVLWIVPGLFFGWIVDIVSTILFGKPKFFA